jgi:hypothetical protein
VCFDQRRISDQVVHSKERVGAGRVQLYTLQCTPHVHITAAQHPQVTVISPTGKGRASCHAPLYVAWVATHTAWSLVCRCGTTASERSKAVPLLLQQHAPCQVRCNGVPCFRCHQVLTHDTASMPSPPGVHLHGLHRWLLLPSWLLPPLPPPPLLVLFLYCAHCCWGVRCGGRANGSCSGGSRWQPHSLHPQYGALHTRSSKCIDYQQVSMHVHRDKCATVR